MPVLRGVNPQGQGCEKIVIKLYISAVLRKLSLLI
jgi:hypothetical protein